MAQHLAFVLGGHTGDDWRRAYDWLAATSAADGARRIISLADGGWSSGAMLAHGTIVPWRNSIPYAQYLACWQAAYRGARDYMNALRASAREFLSPFFHVLAEQWLKCLVVRTLLRGPENIAVVFPPEFAPVAGQLGFSVCTGARWVMPGHSAVVSPIYIARKVGQALRAFGAGRGDAPKPAPDAQVARHARRGVGVLLVVEDTQSGLYRRPALEVAGAVRLQGCDVRLVTNSQAIADDAQNAGVPVEFLHPARSPWAAVRGATAIPKLRLAVRDAARETHAEVPSELAPVLSGLLIPLMIQRACYRSALDRCLRTSPVASLATLSESTPLALSSLQWAKERFIPTSGYWPALLGDRPDCTHFLADHHLVYGDQLRDLMLREGVAAGSVKSVGSLTYDAARGRSRESDLEQVRRLLGDWRDDEHLVVVGTEALPGQMDEIAEAVRALLELRCVYVVIKVHPSDDPAPFERLAQAQASRRIKVICQCDLHALLHAARLLICIMSNIILIAAQLGTPSLVFDPTNKRAQLDFVKEGGCFGCFKAVDLKAMIQGLLTDSELRAKAIAKLGVGMLRFNAFNDGQSATRVAKEIVRVADRSAGEANAAKLCG